MILGDTSDSRSLLVAARGADVLVHEATVIEQEADLAAHRGHSTACMSSSILVIDHMNDFFQQSTDAFHLLQQRLDNLLV